MQKFKKFFFGLIFSTALFAGIASGVSADLIENPDLDASRGDSQMGSFVNSSGFIPSTSNTVGGIVATVIEAFLTLLAIIFVILVLIAGYKWMTASGNEEKVKEAKTQLRHAIIGLAIIIMAYAITHFIFQALGDVTGGGGESYPL
jgi:cytochrome bd-type quinol oxidase subunit 2